MNKIYTYILAFILGAVSYACSNDIDDEGTEISNDSPMELTFRAPAPPKTAGTVTPVQDGSVMKDLAVFITKEENGQTNVMAYRCITGVSDQKLMKFDMKKEDTKDKDWVRGYEGADIAETDGTRYSVNIQPPAKGEYHVYAVANFSKYKNINDIINTINTSQPITSEILNTQFTELKSKVISLGKNNLCNAHKAMLLSVHDVFYIGPGNNTHVAHLLRAFTRIRVTVRNESYKYPLRVDDIKFNNITRKSIPLFVMPGYTPGVGNLTPDIKTDGALASGNLAIEPFKVIEIAKNSQNASNNKAVVFDGYILESSAVDQGKDTKYMFTIDVTEMTGTTTTKTQYTKGTPQTSMPSNDLNTLYLIKVKDEDNYLTVGADNQKASKTGIREPLISNESLNRCLWKKGTNNSLVSQFLETEGLPKYILNDGNSVNVGFYNYANVINTDNNGIYWTTSDGWNYYTYTVTKNIKWATYYGTYPESNFDFIPLSQQQITVDNNPQTADFKFTKLVNDKSQTVRSISRNDFYDIFINVRYNETSKTFDFSVEGWDDVNLPIEFN